jgi:uncharacterized integral membrane protein
MDRASLGWVLAACAWLSFAGIAVICGGLRVRLLEPRLGEARAHVVGTLAVCVLLFAAMQPFVVTTGFTDTWPLMRIGAFWTLLTIGFESAFGLLVLKKRLDELFADYNSSRAALAAGWSHLLGPVWWGTRTSPA